MNETKVIDREEALKALAESKSKELLFAETWREAVALIGEEFFMLKKPLHECTDKWEMESTPKDSYVARICSAKRLPNQKAKAIRPRTR
jgi:hypothetical protein